MLKVKGTTSAYFSKTLKVFSRQLNSKNNVPVLSFKTIFRLLNCLLLACEQALLFGRVKRAAQERASEWRGVKERRDRCKLSFLSPAFRFRVSSRVPLRYTFHGELARRLFPAGYHNRWKGWTFTFSPVSSGRHLVMTPAQN